MALRVGMIGRSKTTNGTSPVELNLSRWRYENMSSHVMILMLMWLCNYASSYDGKVTQPHVMIMTGLLI